MGAVGVQAMTIDLADYLLDEELRKKRGELSAAQRAQLIVELRTRRDETARKVRARCGIGVEQAISDDSLRKAGLDNELTHRRNRQALSTLAGQADVREAVRLNRARNARKYANCVRTRWIANESNRLLDALREHGKLRRSDACRIAGVSVHEWTLRIEILRGAGVAEPDPFSICWRAL